MINNTVPKFTHRSFFKLKNITRNVYHNKFTIFILIMALNKQINEI